MASGEKLPRTNLNLIQDIDMIDHEDINAIAQAVEANSAKFTSLRRGVVSDIDVNIQGTDDMNRLFVQPLYRGINVPTTNIGVLIHIPYSPDWAYQMWTDIHANRRFSRYYIAGNTWTDWQEIGHYTTKQSTRSMVANQSYAENRQISVVEKNGWVTVDFRIRCENPSDSFVTLYTGLPKPANGQYMTIPSIGASRASLGSELITTGELMFRFGEATTSYIGSFTYPIANS